MEAKVTRACKRHRLLLAALAIGGASAGLGCNYDLPVDNAVDNPGVNGPTGIVQGTASYFGPGPCVRNGKLEGALIILVFDYLNPPPPAGLATTAVTFATVPAERLFQGLSRPTDPKVPGGGDIEYCPPLDSSPVPASAQYTISQLPAGHYQIRAFFSRQNKFFPLFDFEELPLAGDTQGGAVIDPTAANPQFIDVVVGVTSDPKLDPNDPATPLKMPDSGFFLGGVPVVVGQTLRTGRPYFHVDFAGSHGFVGNADKERAKDVTTAWPADKDSSGAGTSDGPHAAFGYDDPQTGDVAGILMPQDHPITSNQKIACTGNPDPSCDIFAYAQASLPSIHFRYGFPGNANDPTQPDAFGETSPDAWLAKNAKPSTTFDPNVKPTPYYGVDPLAGGLAPGAPLPPEATKFQLTRNFNPDGTPAILVDNNDLKTLAQIADLFPQVVLAKLADDGHGNLVQPIQPQSDPIVVIQGFTLRQGSMKATAEGDVAAGGLAKAGGDPGQTNPLHTRTGEELYDEFTAMIRPAALCISPHDPNLRGTLVAPYEIDPNPNALIKPSFLVTNGNILASQPRVKSIEYGCLPPGFYAVNIVYPTGQAWTTPNLMGECGFTVTGKPDEDCLGKVGDITAFLTKGFEKRPFLTSQMLWDTDSDSSSIHADKSPKKPLIVEVTPSLRCMDQDPSGVWINHPAHEDTNHDGVLQPEEDANGNGVLDMAVPNVCLALTAPGGACIKDQQCVTRKCTGGVCVAKNVGDACTDDAECASITCDSKSNTCAKARAGVPCTSNDFCANGCDTTKNVCK